MKNKSLNKRIFRVIVALLLLFSFSVSAQSLTGTRGLIKAPTARMYESGTLAIGMGYVPAKFFKRTYSYDGNQGVRTGSSGLNTFITVNLTSFIEVMFRYSHELNNKVNMTTQYFPDRMFTARFKLIEEKKNRPAFVLGLQDISALTETTCESCTNFTATYIVGSKYFQYKNFDLDFSFGYAADLLSLPAKDFKGFFGGVEIKHNEFKQAQILIDYDTTSLNIGLQGYLFNRIHTVLGLMDFEPMFILAYRYKI
ncbi:MAG: YjbH domain-containing protein [Oceanospirillaceae bacterium]|nr:YjbH domain-containing protein [Oceanospirillaceae bacterium]